MQLLQRVLTAVVLIPIVLVLILKAPISLLAVIAAVVALLAVHELLRLSESYGIRPQRWPVFIYVGLFFLFLAINPGATPLLETGSFSHSAILAAGLAPFIFLTIAMWRADLATAFPAALVSAFAFAYVALPLAFLVQLREQWAGAFLVIYLLLVVWAGDIFAYFVGKAVGRHRMSPRISPNKTWEGAAASVVASVGVGLLLYHHALAISSWLLNAHFIERRDGYFGNQ
ncbi:MAG TPA: phosphatidate cytidylyltransferase, partial [Terriglobales bacterium]|nr:phosphatidate cytidylyltransferase [Terriglobales bacterium]